MASVRRVTRELTKIMKHNKMLRDVSEQKFRNYIFDLHIAQVHDHIANILVKMPVYARPHKPGDGYMHKSCKRLLYLLHKLRVRPV